MLADGSTVADASSPLNGQVLNMTGGVYPRGDSKVRTLLLVQTRQPSQALTYRSILIVLITIMHLQRLVIKAKVIPIV